MASAPRNRLNGNWLFWEVAMPLLLPVAMSFIVVGLVQTGPAPPQLSLAVIVDLTPWTLSFFSMTLLCSSLRKMWPKIGQHTAIAVWMLALTLIVALYAGFLVLWRHDPSYQPAVGAYSVSIALTLLTIWRCHASSRL